MATRAALSGYAATRAALSGYAASASAGADAPRGRALRRNVLRGPTRESQHPKNALQKIPRAQKTHRKKFQAPKKRHAKNSNHLQKHLAKNSSHPQKHAAKNSALLCATSPEGTIRHMENVVLPKHIYPLQGVAKLSSGSDAAKWYAKSKEGFVEKLSPDMPEVYDPNWLAKMVPSDVRHTLARRYHQIVEEQERAGHVSVLRDMLIRRAVYLERVCARYEMACEHWELRHFAGSPHAQKKLEYFTAALGRNLRLLRDVLKDLQIDRGVKEIERRKRQGLPAPGRVIEGVTADE